jgi:hypothetical protein
MKPGHIEIFSEEPKASIPFYETLGFTLTSVQADKFVWMDLDGSEILIRPGSRSFAPTYKDAAMAMVLYSSDIKAIRARLVSSEVDIHEDEGEGCITIQDPGGHWIQIVDMSSHS